MTRANAIDLYSPPFQLGTIDAVLSNIDSLSEQALPGESVPEPTRPSPVGNGDQDRTNLEKHISERRTHRQELGHLLEAGKQYYADGRLEAAADCYREALGIRKDSMTALYSLGIISGQLHQYREAKELFSRRLELLQKSDSTIVREVLAASGGSHQEVLAAAYQGLGASSLNLWCEMAAANRREPPKELAADAESEFRKATLLRPNFFLAWLGLGVSLHILERLDEAEAAFRKALELEPGSEVAVDRLRRVLEDKVEHRLFESGFLRGLRKPIYDLRHTRIAL